MDKQKVMFADTEIDVYSFNTIIVGSGAAGFNAADSLYKLGQTDIAIITEGVNRGTSRNTGSDKQTYYKLTLAGEEGDSVMEMAKTLFNGGARHGDIALVEAALSARCFYKLVEIGVEFPFNQYGEYVGYKTDHDPRQRATSVGPLTSKLMTERLEDEVRKKNIKIFDKFLVISVLTAASGSERSAIGLITLDLSRLNEPSRGLTLFNATNIIYATGAPAAMYETSVYPGSQTGASGAALAAGVRGLNVTESQFGIASTKFRWNLSGTYQQVLPRYISTAADGSDAKEFLNEYFPNPGAMLTAVFLKGYEWPFDPRKIANYGSSLIDILVFHEREIKGRRVFLDYRQNPQWAMANGRLDLTTLSGEAYKYLENSNAIFGTPIERLKLMNPQAVELYRSHGIELENELLEIAVCVQHNNGGLSGNIWWESNIKHFFPVGEVNGSFGVYRPGGSALNATQVGSLRAAQYIAARYYQPPRAVDEFLKSALGKLSEVSNIISKLTADMSKPSNLAEKFQRLRSRMTVAGGHIRNSAIIEQAIADCRQELLAFPTNVAISAISELPNAMHYYDYLLTQFVYLSAMADYCRQGGQSRGSYLIYNPNGTLPAAGLPESFRYTLDDGRLAAFVQEVELTENLECRIFWDPVRPIPKEKNWFETVWASFCSGEVYNQG